MANSVKLELEKCRMRLEYFKVRNQQIPSAIHGKWVEIFADRVKKLERQLQRAESRERAARSH